MPKGIPRRLGRPLFVHQVVKLFYDTLFLILQTRQMLVNALLQIKNLNLRQCCLIYMTGDEAVFCTEIGVGILFSITNCEPFSLDTWSDGSPICGKCRVNITNPKPYLVGITSPP